MAQVQESHSVIYTNPIKLKTGDRVTIEKWETHPDWIGWAFCSDDNGIKGWVSEKYLKVDGNSAEVTGAYEATEVNVAVGEFVQIKREEFGWAWIQNGRGEQGWVPSKNLTRIS